MKKLTFVAAAALMATSAFAADHSINLQGRMSWINTNRDISKTHEPSDSRFKLERADLTFNGKLTANTTYQLGLFLSSNSITDLKDGTSQLIDSAYLTRTLAEGLTLDFGKRTLLGGGFEVTHGTVDQYLTSNYWSTIDTTGNQFGLTLSKEFMGHNFMLQAFNGNKDRTSNSKQSQSKLGWAAEWMGSYAAGMVKSNVGYTVVPNGTAAASTKQSTNLLAAGVQVNVAKTTIEADYALETGKNAINSNRSDSKKSSIVASVAYNGMENLTPFAKVVVDTNKDYDSATHTGEKTLGKTSWALGLEYKESAKDAIRYHAAYSSSKYKYETIAGTAQGTDKTESTILVGAKIDVNVL